MTQHVALYLFHMLVWWVVELFLEGIPTPDQTALI